MTELLRRQTLFARLLPKLLNQLDKDGWVFTIGEVWRPPEMVELYVQRGLGSPGSVHPLKLAADINLIEVINGRTKLVTDSEAHRDAGKFWKSLDPLCRWGGDFKDSKGRPKPDGNHYSVESPDGHK